MADNIMTLTKLKKQEKEKQSLKQSEQERISNNIVQIDQLTSDDIWKLMSENLSELTDEQREKYQKIIKQDTINGKMLLEIGKRVTFDQIAEKLDLNMMHKLEFQDLINKILNRKLNDHVENSNSNSSNTPKLIQNITSTDCVIGSIHNTAKEQTNNTNCKIYNKGKQDE